MMMVFKTTTEDRLRWREAVRQVHFNTSKPFPRDFDNSKYSQTYLRWLGERFECFRRTSGLCLPAPDPHSAECFKVYEEDANSFEPSAPHTLLDQPIPPRFAANMPLFKSKSSFILHIPGGAFHGHDYTLFDDRMRPIDWGPPFWATDCGLPGTMFRKRLRGPESVAGSAVILSAPAGGGNIWHFLFDSLPKLRILKSAGMSLNDFDHILIDSLRMPYVGEVLEMLGIDRAKLIETEKRPFLRFNELTHVTLGCVLPPDKWVLEWVRATFLPASQPKRSDRKIFISRAGATRRRLIDEEVIAARLGYHGFESVSLEKLSLKEQIGIMTESACIVGSHGAGLTNIVWAPQGAKLVELFAPEYVNVCYWAIAEMLGQKYSFALGEPGQNPDVGNTLLPEERARIANIGFPDPDELVKRVVEFTR